MKKHSKAIRFAASLFAVALVASACGGSDEEAVTEETVAEEEPAAEPVSYPTLEQCAEVTYDYTYTPPASAGMTVTYDIADEAVWEDGSAITAADFKATWEPRSTRPVRSARSVTTRSSRSRQAAATSKLSSTSRASTARTRVSSAVS